MTKFKKEQHRLKEKRNRAIKRNSKTEINRNRDDKKQGDNIKMRQGNDKQIEDDTKK